jgi:glucocorticoid receptor DNA-binding factor 1
MAAGNYFGSDLITIVDSDETAVPRLVTNCIEYIEASGLTQEGLYRLSGSSAQVMKLKSILDRGIFN